MRVSFHTHTRFSQSVLEMLKRIADTFPEKLDFPVKAYVAGGAAVHLYTGSRVSEDLDVEFSKRVIVPQDLVISYQDENGVQRGLIFDTNYNPTFGLMHEDYPDAALFVDYPKGDTRLEVYVLSPVDLAVSKLARFSDGDRLDIKALAEAGLLKADDLRQRASEALSYYIGATSQVKHNVNDALAVVELAERQLAAKCSASKERGHGPSGT